MIDVWLVCKHPPYPFATGQHIAAFTIHSQHASKQDAQAESDKRNAKRPIYLYTVRRLRVTAPGEGQR